MLGCRLLIGSLTVALAAVSPALATTRGDEPTPRPNIIVVNTDDQQASLLSRQVMPKVMDLIVDRGARFRRSIVSTPLCCPSRAVFLSGAYGHNNGVLWNIPGYRALREPDNTLPVWLRRAGYRTVHIGKYLNLYRQAAPSPAAVPPGWSEWHTMLDPVAYYGFDYAENGGLRTLEPTGRNYAASVFNREAVRQIRRFGPGRRPLFMVVDQLAPHRWGQPVGKVARCRLPSPEPAPRDARRFVRRPLPRPPSFNEPDVADKPSVIRGRDRYGPAQVDEIERTYRCGMAALRSVDRGVGQIWRELGRIGERRNSMLIFTSDNGFFYGEHRLHDDKQIPYRESVEVPLAIRLPPSIGPAPKGVLVDRLVANVDLPATILDVAGGRPCAAPDRCRVLDGRSLVGLSRGRDRGWPRHRAIPLELNVDGASSPDYNSCRYQGVWTGMMVYLSHSSVSGGPGIGCGASDQSELYDLRSDPFQLENLLPAPAGSDADRLRAALAARADRLSECTGIAGRDVPQPGRSLCE